VEQDETVLVDEYRAGETGRDPALEECVDSLAAPGQEKWLRKRIDGAAGRRLPEGRRPPCPAEHEERRRENQDVGSVHPISSSRLQGRLGASSAPGGGAIPSPGSSLVACPGRTC